jgi:hypothetical protein
LRTTTSVRMTRAVRDGLETMIQHTRFNSVETTERD